jgi:ABC-type molybdate transport system substrate-binding protein
MNKFIRLVVFFIFAIDIFSGAAATATPDTHEIASITVLADNRLALPLAELASRFSHENMTSVTGVFGISEEQTKKIEGGESADLFITTDPQLVQRLKTKGLVDVYSITCIASRHDLHFTAAIVAGENMTPARSFLAFLKSEEARGIFRKNGLSGP